MPAMRRHIDHLAIQATIMGQADAAESRRAGSPSRWSHTTVTTEKSTDDHPAIPEPVPPGPRREPLPSQSPKPAEDDPYAPARVATLLKSASYRRADEDLDFLARDGMRGVRLQIDYLKPELLLTQNRVRNTIVVFGSARLQEPLAARRRVAALKDALAVDPANKHVARRLAVAERVLDNSRYYEVAREFGRLVSASQETSGEPRAVVMTGGGPGIMEAANRGAFDIGAKSVGLNISLPHEQYPNPYISPELCFSFHYFAMRKLHFLLRARALVAFPGGFGTFDELFEVLTLIQTRKIAPMPVVLVGERFWRKAIDFDFLIDEGVVAEEDRELFWFAETAQDVWTSILNWHTADGTRWHVD
jgi:uncharacterized protein (TIGR00730 family)